jgi:hypothetical protein
MSKCTTVEVTRTNRRSVVIGGKTNDQVIEVSDPGVAGPPNILSIGTVVEGTVAQVTITGTPPAQVLNFVLPVGGIYTHVQSVPSTTWTIVHNLGYYPSVTVVDSADSAVIGDVSYVSDNELTVSFSVAFGGKAYLS